MLDNSFRARYDQLPIATYAISEPPLERAAPFMLTHHHSEFEVIAVVSGRCEVTIDQTVYQVSGGDLLLIPPYSLHSGRILPGGAFSHFCFCFDTAVLGEPKFLKQLESGCLGVKRVVEHAAPGSGELFELAQGVYRECEERGRGWELLVRGQLLCLMGMLEQRGQVFSTICEAARCDFSTRALDILGRTYASPITSRDVAAQMSYSQSYFCRVFRENFSLSFQQYLCRYRLCKARMLLSQNELPVGEVAARVGFNNLSYFARQFRALYGCTPKKFQAMQTVPDKIYGHYLGNPVGLHTKRAPKEVILERLEAQNQERGVTEVVAALIRRGGRFLICQRPAHKARGLLWEFAGGKVEPGETKAGALVRECREELGIAVEPGEVFLEVTHPYPDLTIHLTVFNARILQGEPQLLEHADLRWITAAEIPRFGFCPADQVILQKLRQE